jgi:hypothetical protein
MMHVNQKRKEKSMDWKNTMLRKMTVVMLGGVLLSPFVSNANDVGGHGSQAIGNGGAGNHMVISDQFNNDLDMTNIVMDGDHMSGNSLHTNNGNGYRAETTKTVITMGNSGGRNSRTNGSRTWDDHHENDHGNFTTPTGGSYGHSGRSNGTANYHSSGSGMGGMH